MYIFKVVVFCHGQVCMGLMTMATPNTPTALLAARGTMMNHEIWGHLPVRIRIGMTPGYRFSLVTVQGLKVLKKIQVMNEHHLT